MTFPLSPKNFTLYNRSTSTATISSIEFVTSSGTAHQADISLFGGPTTFTAANFAVSAITIPPLGSIGPFQLDYDKTTGYDGTYTNSLTIRGLINSSADWADATNIVVISPTPTADPGLFDGGGGGEAAATCADSNSCTADGGGGGGGGKVICTALYELGLMDKAIYEYDQAFGLWLYQNNPVAYKGYRMWADILVAYVKGEGKPLLPRLMFWKSRDEQQAMSQRIAVAVAQFVGSAFAKEIARRAGHDLPWTLRGWLTVSLGLTVCKGIGYVFAKTKKYKELTQ